MHLYVIRIKPKLFDGQLACPRVFTIGALVNWCAGDGHRGLHAQRTAPGVPAH